ncbi:hypothetical protein PV05_06516 [Exophiala xenobiotica]|uniref:Uncharacterized protein n=1 Tax=Exophiala xenobiotica TaxID=348802 RepID=A0A0D2F2H6_9EURO|nr:uncharacterized protein PV05_06516 [Exophiala xenobiotica]KIW54134.1 hypothetical protein PV05_06516 [Exophiala xenobiotica]
MNTASRILAAAVSITTPYYIYQVSRQISDVYPSTVTVTNTTSASYLESKSHCTVNPRNCTGLHDTRSIVVELPPTKRAYSDEQILAAYIQGYFGGWVFAPERRALQLLRRRLVNFTALKIIQSRDTATNIWSYKQLSSDRLPPLHTVLFGAFQVVDCRLTNHQNSPEPAESYIDFGFGSDTSHFSGFHRFSIHRDSPKDLDPPAGPATSTTVTITNSCLACDPSKNNLFGGSLLHSLHKFYAMLLFQEGVARVRALET